MSNLCEGSQQTFPLSTTKRAPESFVCVQSAGKEHNFNTYNDTTSSSLGVPYDYGSMMHYSKNAFRNGIEPTIITKIPAFSDVIGQRMEFSDSDLLKLNRLYNCSKGQQSALLSKQRVILSN